MCTTWRVQKHSTINMEVYAGGDYREAIQSTFTLKTPVSNSDFKRKINHKNEKYVTRSNELFFKIFLYIYFIWLFVKNLSYNIVVSCK